MFSEFAYSFGYSGNKLHEKFKINSFSFSAGPVLYFNTSVGIEFLLNYTTENYIGISGRSHRIGFGTGLQIHLEKK